VNHEFQQHQLQTILLGSHSLWDPLHWNFLLKQLRDPPLASQLHDCSWQQIVRKPITQRLGTCPHSQDFYKEGNEGNESKDILYRGSGEGKLPIRFKQAETFSMQFVKIMEQPKAVHPTSGKKYRWLGFWRKRIGSITWVTIFWRWCEMDPCTGSHAGGRRFSDNCKLAAGGKVLILLKRFSGGGWRHIWRYLHSKFEMEGRMEGEATNH